MTRSAWALVLALLVGACSAGAPDASEQRQRCQALAETISVAALRTTPAESTAREVAHELDDRLPRLGSPAVHGPAVEVHNSLHTIEKLLGRGNKAEAAKAAGEARSAIDRLATACALPVGSFYGEASPTAS